MLNRMFNLATNASAFLNTSANAIAPVGIACDPVDEKIILGRL